MRTRCLLFTALTCIVSSVHAQFLADYQAATRMAWGEGTGLPAPYTTQDMAVTLRVRVLFLWTSYNLTSNIPEQVIPKDSGDLGFSINLQDINPLAPNVVVNVPGTAFAANTCNWTMNQTFSQTGGFPFSGTFDNNGTPITFDLVLNNIAVTGNLRSDFAATTPFFNAVLGQNSKNRGTYVGGDTNNWINVIPGSVSGTVNGIAINGLEMRYRNIQHLMHVPYRPTVSGSILLNDVSTGNDEPVSWEMLDGASVVVSSGTLTPAESSAYTLETDTPVGSYSMRVKGRTHLAQAVPVTVLESSTANFALTNGDCDGDNEVGPGDFGLLSSAFGSVDGDSNWDADADLDRDGEVGPSDFGILSSNFGLSGD